MGPHGYGTKVVEEAIKLEDLNRMMEYRWGGVSNGLVGRHEDNTCYPLSPHWVLGWPDPNGILYTDGLRFRPATKNK